MSIIPFLDRAAPFALDPAIALLGNEREGLALDFVNMRGYVRDRGTPANFFLGDPNDLLTYTLPSTKYVMNDAGLLVAGTTLRCDHGADGDPLGLLVEPQRTNLLLNSENISQHNPQNITVVANGAVAPDGNTTADLIHPTTGSGINRRLLSSVTATQGTNYASSCFVKSAGWRWMSLSNVGSSVNADISWFDIIDGVAGTVGANNVVSSIEDCGDGWWRISVAGPADATGHFLLLAFADADGSSTATADGTSGAYVWGVQLEAGSFPTSYIQTTSAQVTRSADQISLATSKFPLGSAHTLITEASAIRQTGYGPIVQLGDGTANERIDLGSLDDDGLQIITDNNAQLALWNVGDAPNPGIFANSAFVKSAVAAAVNDAIACANGVLGAADTAVTLPTPTTLKIGSDHLNRYWGGHIRSIVYLPRRAANSELQTRTAA